jgi:arylsulfatase A-like enzyme
MVKHINDLDAAAPEQPFFVYYAPSACHSPHQPTQEWIDKFKGKFDMGWNAVRDEIFANQKRLGVVPPTTELTEWPDSLPKWETLSADVAPARGATTCSYRSSRARIWFRSTPLREGRHAWSRWMGPET